MAQHKSANEKQWYALQEDKAGGTINKNQLNIKG